MRTFVLLLAALTCSAADWTCAGGLQKHEKILSVQSAGKLQLVVKRKLGNEPLGAPVMIGRLVTHKGIKDLVFIAGGRKVYAVDSDLGTLFWERHLGTESAVTPMLQPNADGADEDDDYMSTGVRPVFLAHASGKISALNSTNGADLAASMAIPVEVRVCSQHVHGIQVAVANGVRFELASIQARPLLRALDARDGRELYTSGNQIEAPVDSSGLAIANGHVCFGDAAGTLYCFGFPVDP